MAILHPEYAHEYNKYLSSLITRVKAQKNGVDTIYHYTPSLATINGILENREIWLTNIGFLNDPTELDYIQTLTEEEQLDGWIKEHLQAYKPMTASFGTQTYIMSFSEKKDYLPLWSTFTQMSGYSVGLNLEKLNNEVLSKTSLNIDFVSNNNISYEVMRKQIEKNEPNADFQGFFGGGDFLLAPVVYKKAEQVEILNTILKEALLSIIEVSRTVDKGLPQNTITQNGKEIGRIIKNESALKNAITKVFDLCATIFKSEDFAYEHEWRLIKNMTANNINLIRRQFYVREIGGAAVPYIKMSMRNNLYFPVEEIIVAPLLLADTTIASLEFLLHNMGYNYDVAVSKSKIKLRR